jgi:ribosomal protein L11 methyltransferase
MNYYVYHFALSPLREMREVIIASLEDLPFESFEDTEAGLDAYLQEPDDCESDVLKLVTDLSEIGKINYTKDFIPEQNWNASWEADYPVVEVEHKCIVRAPFHKVDDRFQIDVIIQPKMSFGTGHHATTYLMISMLFELDLNNKKVLDMGSGTGVLAIAAQKLGAKEVLAIDIEEWAYQNTIENMALNNVNIRVDKGDASLLKGETFDIILANINKNVLIQDMGKYANSLAVNGHILLSGFFDVDVDEISASAEEYGLKIVVKHTRNMWAALHFRKDLK